MDQRRNVAHSVRSIACVVNIADFPDSTLPPLSQAVRHLSINPLSLTNRHRRGEFLDQALGYNDADVFFADDEGSGAAEVWEADFHAPNGSNGAYGGSTLGRRRHHRASTGPLRRRPRWIDHSTEEGNEFEELRIRRTGRRRSCNRRDRFTHRQHQTQRMNRLRSSSLVISSS